MEIRILVHDWFEFVLAETIGVNVMESSVEEFGLVAEKILVTTDDGFVAKFDVEVLLMGVAEPNAVLSILLLGFLKVFSDDIDLLIHFFIFFEYVLLHSIKAWL